MTGRPAECAASVIARTTRGPGTGQRWSPGSRASLIRSTPAAASRCTTQRACAGELTNSAYPFAPQLRDG